MDFPETSHLYRTYLALTALRDRFERAGLDVALFSDININPDPGGRTHAQEMFSRDIEEGEVSSLVWADVRLSMPSDVEAGDVYRLVALMPEARVAVAQGWTLIYGVLHGISYRIGAGSALCEQVQVGTRIEEVPDPELLAEVPTIQQEVPVMEWRCLDELPKVDFS